jgi:hypothetical protein
MTYINISRRPNRQKRSERRNNDIHGAGVCGTVQGILRISLIRPYN